ncbi:DNA cytosine methyltransferase [Acholeplasma equifetale]|uniref:DNA cytosine methyltransferase n=1 Tax=Acholeplasma equifetale TaxID=264634 RepID=UPI00138B0D26|nr:DNA cytosine methyltransferase [Acholeplasma equifetale]
MKTLSKNFTFIDLFAGIGGFHYAMKRYSKKSKCVFASEINKNAIKLYKLNHGLDSNYDIKEIKGKDIPKFDVICAGFPCQSFSKAGKQQGFNDERGILFNEIERIIKEKIELNEKPKILVLENVKNLISHDKSKTWKTIKEKIQMLGYNIIDKPLIFSPSDFNVPQLRDRAIILAVDNDIYSGKLDFEKEIPTKTLKKSIYDILERDLPENEEKKYKLTRDELKILDAWDDFIKSLKVQKIGFPIWSDYFYDESDISSYPTWKQDFIKKNKEFYGKNKDIIDEWYTRNKIKEFIPTHRKFEWQAGEDIKSVYEGLIQFRPSGIRVKRPTTSPTLVAMKHVPIIGKYKRYLTPRESARLQSLPESFEFDNVGDDIYRLLGNAVNVEVIYQVFKTFVNYIDRVKGEKIL